MKKYSENAISSLLEDWGRDVNDNNLPFSGQAVQDFIKNQLGIKVGYVSLETEDDVNYLFCYRSEADYQAYIDDKSKIDELVLYRLALPTGSTQSLDTYSIALERPEGDDAEIITTETKVYIHVRANSKVKRAGSDRTVQLRESGTLTISTASGSSNAFTKRRSMSLTSIDNEDHTDNFTTIDVSNYITKDATVKVRLSWRGSESQLTRQMTYIITQSTFGLSYVTPYENPFMVGSSANLQFATTGAISKTLYVKVEGLSTHTDHYENPLVGDQVYTHHFLGLTGDVTSTCSITGLAEGTYKGTYWVCTDDVKSEVKSFQFLVSDQENGIEMVINNVGTDIANWSQNRIFDYSFCGYQTTNIKFVFWSTDMSVQYGTYVASSVAPKVIHPLNMQLEFNIDTVEPSIRSIVRAYRGDANVTATTTPIAEEVIVIDTSNNFAPTSMADGFILDPKTRSNSQRVSDNEIVINSKTGSAINGVVWSNMDWLNGGWTVDENDNKCLRVLAGSKVTIPFKALGTMPNSLRNGFTIEVDFASRNVSDDTNAIINISKKGSHTEPSGVILYPNIAYVYTDALRDSLNQDTEYQEDTRTHFTTNCRYGHEVVVDGRHYAGNIIRTYVNGTIAREFMYADDDTFGVEVENIVIGSESADVDIYGIRIYKDQALKSEEIEQDYLSALPSFADKKRFMEANSITNSDGTINYDLAKGKYRTIKFKGHYPSFRSTSSDGGELTVIYLQNEIDEFGNYEIDHDNSFIISNMKCKGQGSTSKQYYKWNATWSFSDKSVYHDINGNVVPDHNYVAYVERDDDNELVQITPRATKLVGKLNYASSMQSHKQGSLNMYEALRNQMGFKSEIQKADPQGEEYPDERFDLARTALKEDEFLFFVEENDTVKFYGLMTWGAAKGDKLTYGYKSGNKYAKDMLFVGGSTQNNQLTLCHTPWLTDQVKVSTDDEGAVETWDYAGTEAFDNELGNIDSIKYIRDYINFIFLHSHRLKYYNGDISKMNTDSTMKTDEARSYQYWTSNYQVYRYDFVMNSWVNAGVSENAGTTTDATLNIREFLAGVTVDVRDIAGHTSNEITITVDGTELNGFTPEAVNKIFRRGRAVHLRENIGQYVDINEILFCFCFTLLIAASDNLAKNSYFMVDYKGSNARPKIRPWRDDDDTIFRINNEGTKDKNYYCEYYSQRPDGSYYFTANNSAYYGTLYYAYYEDLRERDVNHANSLTNVMKRMLGAMANLGSGNYANDFDGDAIMGCFNRFYFSIQKYFPSVAYNETARLLYEEAQILGMNGITAFNPEKNPNPITMSMGSSLEGEIQFLKMRTFFMKTFAMYFTGNNLNKLGFMFSASTPAADRQVTVTAGAHMYAFSLNSEDTPGQNYPVRLAPDETTTFTLNMGSTVSSSIVGTDYLKDVGVWYNKIVNNDNAEITLSSKRTTEVRFGNEDSLLVKFKPKTLGSLPSIIEIVDLKNINSLTGTADFAPYKRLKEVYMVGTNFSTVSLPMTNALTKVSLPSEVSKLTLREAPNLKDRSHLNIENRTKLVDLTIYHNGSDYDESKQTMYYGTHFDWVLDWYNNVNLSAQQKRENLSLKMENIKWTLNYEQIVKLSEFKKKVRTLDLTGTIELASDTAEFANAVIDYVQEAFGEDAFNPSNKLLFKVPFTYQSIVYVSTNTEHDDGLAFNNETNNGKHLVEGWSNNYQIYTVNQDVTSVSWTTTNPELFSITNATNSGCTITCKSDIASEVSGQIVATYDGTTKSDTGDLIPFSGRKVTLDVTAKKRTYPTTETTTITGTDLLNTIGQSYTFSLAHNVGFFTGVYDVQWSINKDGYVFFTTDNGEQCSLTVTNAPDQAATVKLTATITRNDNVTVEVSLMLQVGQRIMGNFGDIYCTDGSFIRPTIEYTDTDNGPVAHVTISNPENKRYAGVVVVPRSHTADRTARVMSLAEMNTNSADTGSIVSRQGIAWGSYGWNVPDLVNLDKTPNMSGTTSSWARLGTEYRYNTTYFVYHNSAATVGVEYKDASGNTLSIGKIRPEQVDNLWYYKDATLNEPNLNEMHPSPYLSSSPSENGMAVGHAPFTDYLNLDLNPAYIVKGTATSDYDGEGNTKKITDHVATPDWTTAGTIINNDTSTDGKSSAVNFPAAQCCWRYHISGMMEHGGHAGDWYLPACGELGYIIPKLGTINSIITAMGSDKALTLDTGYIYWSSSEFLSGDARGVNTNNGGVYGGSKYNPRDVRAFLAV